MGACVRPCPAVWLARSGSRYVVLACAFPSRELSRPRCRPGTGAVPSGLRRRAIHRYMDWSLLNHVTSTVSVWTGTLLCMRLVLSMHARWCMPIRGSAGVRRDGPVGHRRQRRSLHCCADGERTHQAPVSRTIWHFRYSFSLQGLVMERDLSTRKNTDDLLFSSVCSPPRTCSCLHFCFTTHGIRWTTPKPNT